MPVEIAVTCFSSMTFAVVIWSSGLKRRLA
jgi:hypothetical protein